MATKKEKGSVSIDAQNIMPVIKRWLYSDKDIFLREAVSNACDAITKFRMLHPDSEETMTVNVRVDKEKKLIKIADTGIGMTADDVRKYINQVAFSGATEFMKQFEDKKPEERTISSATSAWASIPFSWSATRLRSRPSAAKAKPIRFTGYPRTVWALSSPAASERPTART